MSTQVEKLPKERIIIRSFSAEYSVDIEAGKVVSDDLALLDAQKEPVFHILDLRHMKIGFDSLVSGANRTTKGSGYLSHPMQLEIVVVTTNPLLQLAAKGMSSPMLGSRRIKTFETLEAALAYARAELQKQAHV